MTNARKVVTAKAAWARLAAERRALRDALERIATLAELHRRTEFTDTVREIAGRALRETDQEKAA